jgi:hypothetical protein
MIPFANKRSDSFYQIDFPCRRDCKQINIRDRLERTNNLMNNQVIVSKREFIVLMEVKVIERAFSPIKAS